MAGARRRGRPRKNLQNSAGKVTTVTPDPNSLPESSLNAEIEATSEEAHVSKSHMTVTGDISRKLEEVAEIDTAEAVIVDEEVPSATESLDQLKEEVPAMENQGTSTNVEQKTWRSLFAGNRLAENGLTLDYIPPGF